MALSRQLLCIGIGLISFSIVFALVGHFKFPYLSQLTALVASLIGSAGMALIIIAVVENTILRYILEKTSREIVETTTHNLDNKFKETFKIAEHAEYNGLVDILAPILDEERGKYTREIIVNEIKKSKSVRIFSISGLDFFGAPVGGLVFLGQSFSAIVEKIDTAKKENKPLDLEIKALLMKPDSDAAKFRDQIESYDYIKGNIQRNIEDAINGIQILNKRAGKDFIEYRLYSTFPQAGFVLTDSYIFIEIYHYAPAKELSDALMKKGLRATDLTIYRTGGRVPVLQFSSNSNMYVAMKLHFDSIWKYGEEKQKQNKNAT